MARCSLETANFSFPLFFEPLDRRPDALNDEVGASAVPISYGEQNSTIVHQLEIARVGFGVGFLPRSQKGVPPCFL
jgi:hypothetical protein